eukprot:TRINITY_DN38272_c0_g1_i1.p1 TRINITY_DN38272_c0_g1~~TRINITY_DN38272_c0_g1_i1.p1  ORF type:complete len:1234 (+),score=173.96 TRINITY_DN38272_c0_g1_i1:163-3864(+)
MLPKISQTRRRVVVGGDIEISSGGASDDQSTSAGANQEQSVRLGVPPSSDGLRKSRPSRGTTKLRAIREGAVVEEKLQRKTMDVSRELANAKSEPKWKTLVPIGEPESVSDGTDMDSSEETETIEDHELPITRRNIPKHVEQKKQIRINEEGLPKVRPNRFQRARTFLQMLRHARGNEETDGGLGEIATAGDGIARAEVEEKRDTSQFSNLHEDEESTSEEEASTEEGQRDESPTDSQGRRMTRATFADCVASLPRQMDSAMLHILLEDLIEFNGVSYRAVPMSSFREKYVGLYFATLDDEKSSTFLERLKAYYTQMNHKFECVLVSCDGSDDAYKEHTQLTSWPTYPRGDFRPAVLRNFFDVVCPMLVIMDPNGVVLTCKGVEHIEGHRKGFPWVDGTVESLWGRHIRGETENLLNDMMLPAYRGFAHHEYEVLGLLVGEPWCPELRRLAKKLNFLIEELRAKQVFSDSGKDIFAAYFVHTEAAARYSLFQDYNVEIPHVRLTSGKMQAINYFFGMTCIPALCILSPRAGWRVPDAADWLQKDPTGICFPWLPKNVILPSDQLQERGEKRAFCDTIRELHEGDVNAVLLSGPAFVAILGDGCNRTETIAMLRSVATAYCSLIRQRNRDLQKGPLSMFEKLCIESDYDELQASTASPSRGRVLPHESDVSIESKQKNGTLYKVLQKTLERQRFTLQGSAPWNTQGHFEVEAPRAAALNFFYCHKDSRTAQVLNRYCCSNIDTIYQSELHYAVQARRDQAASTKKKELDDVSADIWKRGQIVRQELNRHWALNHDHERRDTLIGKTLFNRRSPPQEPSPSTSRKSSDDTAGPVMHPRRTVTRITDDTGSLPTDFEDSEPSDELIAGKRFHARTESRALRELSEQILLDGKKNRGSATIIDLVKGSYAVCGDCGGRAGVCKFIDGWYTGELDEFEIGMVNPMINVRDEDLLLSRQISAIFPEKGPMLPSQKPFALPVTVIWIPNTRHTRNTLNVTKLYRAFLNYAIKTGPRVDVIPNDDGFSEISDFALNPSSHVTESRRLTPIIERFWIFALEDSEEAQKERAETEFTWGPPGSEFLRDIRRMFNTLMRKSNEDSPSFDDVAFGPGLRSLRAAKGREKAARVGTTAICMNVESTRRRLLASMLDELSYTLIIQTPPPPMYVLIIGDLFPPEALPWPRGLSNAHLHVLGQLPDSNRYREQVSPSVTSTDWDSWIQSVAEDEIQGSVARYIKVPWW